MSARSTWRTVAVGASATAICVLPVFLIGALAVQIRADIAFGSIGLGLAVGSYRGSAALTAAPLGRWVDRLGARRSIRLAVVVAALVSTGIATTANTWPVLVFWLVLGGCSTSLGLAASHRLLVLGVQSSRLGLAFGVKQTAQPLAATLSGLSVPLIAITFGWRWAFAIAATLAVIVLLAVPGRPPGTRRAAHTDVRGPLRDRPTILLVALAFGLGNIAASTVPAFFVDSAVQSGITPELAGTLLAAASGTALLVRLASGWVGDRIPRAHLQVSAGMLASGSVGLGLLAIGETTSMTIGVVVSLGGAWAYNVLLWVPLMRSYSNQPGAITGAVAPGGLIGGTIGPVLFGVIADTTGYTGAWTAAASAALIGSLVMVMAARRLDRRGQPDLNRMQGA